jgi:hypothetical protein
MNDQAAPQTVRTGYAQPGELMRLVAGGLAGNGHEVALPRFDDGRRLSVTSPAARCALAVEDCGSVVLDWNPVVGSAVDPLVLANVASALLTGQAGPSQWQGHDSSRADLTLKGKVGQELQARGLPVTLEVYTDEVAFEASAAILATAPQASLDAEVRVTDDGWLCWEGDYGVEEAAVCWEEGTTWITDPGKVAAGIVAAINLALSQGLPGQAARR